MHGYILQLKVFTSAPITPNPMLGEVFIDNVRNKRKIFILLRKQAVMNKFAISNTHIHVFLLCLIVAVTPYFILLISFAVWMVPVFIIICLIDYIKGTVMRKKAGLALASMFLASIIGLGIMYLINMYQNP